MLETCGPGAIPGDPAALRRAAELLEDTATLAEAALEDIRSARATVLGAWNAPSADGFDNFISQQLACAAGLIDARRGTARALRDCADELEAAQRRFAAATEDAASAERDLDSAERGSHAERKADSAVEDARADKAAAGGAALSANEHAAREIRTLREGLPKARRSPTSRRPARAFTPTASCRASRSSHRTCSRPAPPAPT